MYLNDFKKELDKRVKERLTLTLDVFKYRNRKAFWNNRQWLTLTLDVFK